MRPIKDILIDSYWTIGYRIIDGKTCLDGNEGEFMTIPTDKRYWYADPFLFKNNGILYLFVETFDNKTEKGFISVSVFNGETFSEPVKVLEESHHLSYPFVFEKDNEIYMMPETHQKGCIQLYRAVDFPYKWEGHRVLVNDVCAVDTVICDKWLIASELDETNDMSISLNLYNIETGQPHIKNRKNQHDFTKRGAGRVFKWGNKTLRPSQSCENGSYGTFLRFWEINEISDDNYEETEFARLYSEDVTVKNTKGLKKIHTYAIDNNIEILDMNFLRLNFRRIYWILTKKFGI